VYLALVASSRNQLLKPLSLSTCHNVPLFGIFAVMILGPLHVLLFSTARRPFRRFSVLTRHHYIVN